MSPVTVWIVGRIGLAILFVLVGFYATWKGFRLVQIGVGGQSAKSRIKLGQFLSARVETVGSLVILTAWIWGFFAYKTVPSELSSDSKGTWELATVMTVHADEITKETLKESPDSEIDRTKVDYVKGTLVKLANHPGGPHGSGGWVEAYTDDREFCIDNWLWHGGEWVLDSTDCTLIDQLNEEEQTRFKSAMRNTLEPYNRAYFEARKAPSLPPQRN